MTTKTLVMTPGTPLSNGDALRLRKAMTHIAGLHRDAVWPGFPVGWLPLALELMKKLHDLRQANPELSQLTVRRLYIHDGIELAIDVNDYETPVVQGIIRKFKARSHHTCSRCGTPGRQRRLGRHDKRILCAPCAAPLLLHRELMQFDVMLDEHFGTATLPLRRVPAGLRQSVRDWVARQEGRRPEPGDEIPIWHVAEWRTAMCPVIARLNKQFKRERNGESDD